MGALRRASAPCRRVRHAHLLALLNMNKAVSHLTVKRRRLALLVGLLGLAATLFADARYLGRAIARRHFSFLIDRAILLTALAVAGAIFLLRLIDSTPI
jgi:hypothetical protein